MKRLLLISFLLGLALTAVAQDKYASSFGLAGESDARALREINARMDSIRQHRPTVALVLSGGGAKGAAIIGTLRKIEEMQIPIDMVIGTSVGGLVGGLYSIGYGPDYLDNMIRNIDWSMALSDKVRRDYIPYSRAKYKEKYVLSIPFYYNKNDYRENLRTDLQYAPGKPASFRIPTNRKDSFKEIGDNLLGSLPSGLVSGQNVWSIIASKTVGVSDSTNFLKFPIPFVCVATDLVSGRAKVWHDGDINIAMRSTMSIPALFAPVRTRGMVLVDGGMRNNFPADLASEMGADLIIGVDLSDAAKDYTDIKHLGDVISQGIDMLGNDAFRRNLKVTDMRIKPQLKGYDMLSFNPVAIDTMIRRGNVAAAEKQEEFDIVKEWVGTDSLAGRHPLALDIQDTPVLISDVVFSGLGEADGKILRRKVRIKPGSRVSRADVESAVATLYGMGAFDSVNYELRGTEEPYELHIICRKGPIHQLGLGIRADTEELVSVLVNVGFNTNSVSGIAYDLTAKVSSNPYLKASFIYDVPKFPTFNASASFRWLNRSRFSVGENRYNITMFQARQEVYLSNMRWYKFDVNGGIRHDVFKISHILGEQIQGDYDITLSTKNYGSIFLNGRAENLDDGYFPTHGYSFGVGTDFIWDISATPTHLFATLNFDGKVVVPFPGKVAFIPSFAGRFIFGDEIPIPYANIMGGMIPGRYVDQQIAFVGINNAVYRRNYLMTARADLRWNFYKNMYATAISEYSYDFTHFSEFNKGQNVWGVGLEYAYDSIVGPLRANLHWNTLTKKVGFYVSLGFDF